MTNSSDDGEFNIPTKQRKKINKNRSKKPNEYEILKRPITHESRSSSVSRQVLKKPKTDEEKVTVSLWMKTAVVGDIYGLLMERLSDLSEVPGGAITTLWPCVHMELKRLINNFEHIDTDALMTSICLDYDINDTNELLIYVILKYQLNLTIISLNKDFQTIKYGNQNAKKVHLLHVGFEYFVVLLPDECGVDYQLSDEDKSLLTKLNSSCQKLTNNVKKEAEIELLKSLNEMLQGTERAQNITYLPKTTTSKKRAYYDTYSVDEIENNKNLKLCTLHMKTAHFAIATKIRKDGDKDTEISILNRKNCGFNAFEGDTVFVEINDRVNCTGKVWGVQHSYHKPINSIYLCKVYRDQGSLMMPLDGTFPKIHVDNEPGRRLYEKELQQRTGKTFKKEQRSFEMERQENSNYADNIYVSIFTLQYDKIKEIAEFPDIQIKRFDPETCDKLFLVCYQYWDISNMYPNGKVVGMISTYDSFKDSLHLILPLCKIEPTIVNDVYKEEINIIKKKVKENVNVPHDIVPAGAMVFTIDNEETRDMDDALSYHVKDNMIVVGVHITDITRYISPQHEIYKQAQRRFATAYIPKKLGVDPVYLIEKGISTHALSLVPNQPRAVLSVMFRFTMTSPRVITNITFHETVIKSKYKLNYQQVEEWIKETEKPSDVEEDLFIAIKQCHEIAKEIRRKRLKDSYFVRQSNRSDPSFNFDDSFNAQFLIEEFMIMANENVAMKIYERYPNMSLIRVQNPVTDYNEWEERLFKHMNMKFPSSLRQYCNLLKITRTSDNDNELVTSLQYYNDFRRYLDEDLNRARNMLQYDEYINDIYVHVTEWYDISHSARYECSVANCVDNRHFSLDKDIYTHFTSPIRRFTDVIVHRMLKSIINPSLSIDSIDENTIEEVCAIANKRLKSNKSFEKRCVPYAIFESSPVICNFVLDCACSKITKEELCFVHPSLSRSSSIKYIKFSHLSLESSPVNLENNVTDTYCDLTWKKIIYARTLNFDHNRLFAIDSHIYDATLSKEAQKLFREIRRSYLSTESLEDKLISLGAKFRISDHSEVMSSDSDSNPIIEINYKLFIKSTLRIQFCSYKVNGLKRVNPELLIINPSFQLCLIHQEDPVMCFIPGGKIQFANNSGVIWEFQSVEQYQTYFRPLLELESLREIMSERSDFTFSDLTISWINIFTKFTNKIEKFGFIKYDFDLFERRRIEIGDENEDIESEFIDLIKKGVGKMTGDFVCLRGKVKDGDNYWIGHGTILHVSSLNVSGSQSTNKVIVFMLTQSDFDVFNEEYDDMLYSAEFFSRSITSKRQMRAVNLIDKDEFLKGIIFGGKIETLQNEKEMVPHLLQELYKVNILHLNKMQLKAITKAMKEKFSLIWGPPGTGKTSIGCILAYCYHIRNKGNGHIIYCGPSNECVNLIIDAMTEKFKINCPRMLRIFSKQQELADFPLPGYFTNSKPLLVSLREKSLHFLVRQKDNKYAQELIDYDTEFARTINSTDSNDKTYGHSKIKEYYQILMKAKQEHIKNNNYTMILCTASVAGSQIMSEFSVRQIIIDEAGMCKEPETLVPLVSASRTVEHVVLIGDHKQLRPIILDNFASKRGLQISLFERYQLLRPDMVTMLNRQYRMHPSICEFPSKYFYSGELFTVPSQKWSGLQTGDFEKADYFVNWNGVDYGCAKAYYRERLKTSGYSAIPDDKWPGQRGVPYDSFQSSFQLCPERLVFINIIGDEITHTISTASCGENSKGNTAEVQAVGYIYNKLVTRFASPRKAVEQITVLTQYRLQEKMISERCKTILELKSIEINPIVKTVIKSQGSENDYIIFSTVRSLRNKADINENPSQGWENKYLGFITDPNQVNVALTRARKGLIIIGNSNLLSVNKMWKSLINDLKQRGCYVENPINFL